MRSKVLGDLCRVLEAIGSELACGGTGALGIWVNSHSGNNVFKVVGLPGQGFNAAPQGRCAPLVAIGIVGAVGSIPRQAWRAGGALPITLRR